MTERMAPIWKQADTDYFTMNGQCPQEGRCIKCHRPLRVGEAYWLDSGSMIREPPLVFHDRCPDVTALAPGAVIV